MGSITPRGPPRCGREVYEKAREPTTRSFGTPSRAHECAFVWPRHSGLRAPGLAARFLACLYACDSAATSLLSTRFGFRRQAKFAQRWARLPVVAHTQSLERWPPAQQWESRCAFTSFTRTASNFIRLPPHSEPADRGTNRHFDRARTARLGLRVRRRRRTNHRRGRVALPSGRLHRRRSRPLANPQTPLRSLLQRGTHSRRLHGVPSSESRRLQTDLKRPVRAHCRGDAKDLRLEPSAHGGFPSAAARCRAEVGRAGPRIGRLGSPQDEIPCRTSTRTAQRLFRSKAQRRCDAAQARKTRTSPRVAARSTPI